MIIVIPAAKPARLHNLPVSATAELVLDILIGKDGEVLGILNEDQKILVKRGKIVTVSVRLFK